MTSKNLTGWIARDQGEDCMIIYKKEICSFGCTPLQHLTALRSYMVRSSWSCYHSPRNFMKQYWNNHTMSTDGGHPWSIWKYLEVSWSDMKWWVEMMQDSEGHAGFFGLVLDKPSKETEGGKKCFMLSRKCYESTTEKSGERLQR